MGLLYCCERSNRGRVVRIANTQGPNRCRALSKVVFLALSAMLDLACGPLGLAGTASRREDLDVQCQGNEKQ
jgi:hypothetical protein